MGSARSWKAPPLTPTRCIPSAEGLRQHTQDPACGRQLCHPSLRAPAACLPAITRHSLACRLLGTPLPSYRPEDRAVMPQVTRLSHRSAEGKPWLPDSPLPGLVPWTAWEADVKKTRGRPGLPINLLLRERTSAQFGEHVPPHCPEAPWHHPQPFPLLGGLGGEQGR